MPRKKMTDVRRKEIAEALYRCIVNQGYASTSVRDIAKEAGMRSGLIHHYFESKEEILSSMTDNTFDKYWENFVQFLQKHKDRPPRERLRAATDFVFRKVAGDRDLNKVFYELWNLSHHNKDLHKSLKKLYRGYREMVENIIRDCLGETSQNADLIKKMAAFLVGASEGLGIQWFIDPRAISLGKQSELANRFIDSIMAAEDSKAH